MLWMQAACKDHMPRTGFDPSLHVSGVGVSVQVSSDMTECRVFQNAQSGYGSTTDRS